MKEYEKEKQFLKLKKKHFGAVFDKTTKNPKLERNKYPLVVADIKIRVGFSYS